MSTQQTLPAPAQTPMPEFPDFSTRLSQPQANALYAMAYQLSERGRHEQAHSMLLLLRMYRPRDPSYSKAMAICCRKMGRYEEAIRFFAQTMELQPDEHGPAFQLIECMVLLGLRENACDLLHMMSELAREQGLTDTLERAEALLEFLQAPLQ